jgi:molybdate transport system substrate-binding protein
MTKSRNALRASFAAAVVAVSVSCLPFVLTAGSFAGAAELKLLQTTAIRRAMDELIPRFETSSGHKVIAEFGPAGAIMVRVQKGEAVDVAIVTGPQSEDLKKQGRFISGSAVELAKVGIGVFVRKGAVKPDISSVEAFKRSLLAARSIAYPDPAIGAPVGIYFVSLVERLGLAAELKSKSKSIAIAAVYDAVAKGDVEVGLGPLSEILAEPRVELVALLPAEIQNFTVFAAGIVAGSQQEDAGKALIRFISSPAAQAIMKAKGFEAP